MKLTKEKLKVGLRVKCSWGRATVTKVSENSFSYTYDHPYNLGYWAGEPAGFATGGEALEAGYHTWEVLE